MPLPSRRRAFLTPIGESTPNEVFLMQSHSQAPAAIAHISGPPGTPLAGIVSFFPQEGGTLVTARIHGLPYEDAPCASRVFGFHIHEGSSCTPPDFQDAGGHFDLDGCTHPHHAGDLPPLFGCRGEAYLSVLTDRFSVPDIVGRTVVIHSDPDDFTTQPSGHSGTRIGCGVIRAF